MYKDNPKADYYCINGILSKIITTNDFLKNFFLLAILIAKFLKELL